MRILGFEDFGISEFGYLDIGIFWNFGILEFWDLVFWDLGIRTFRNLDILEFWDFGIWGFVEIVEIGRRS